MARNPLGGRYSARTSSTASVSTRRQRPRVGPRRTPLRAAARILEARSGPGLTMTSPQQSIPFWLAHSSLQLVLRLWPEETRHWGQALAAELDEIETPFAALHAVGIRRTHAFLPRLGVSLPRLVEGPCGLAPFPNFPSSGK